MRQHLRFLISLLAEMRLKVKEGTHNTPLNVRFSKSVTIPMCVTIAIEPLGNFTCDEATAVMEVKMDELIMCTNIYNPKIIFLFLFWHNIDKRNKKK